MSKVRILIELDDNDGNLHCGFTEQVRGDNENDWCNNNECNIYSMDQFLVFEGKVDEKLLHFKNIIEKFFDRHKNKFYGRDSNE